METGRPNPSEQMLGTCWPPPTQARVPVYVDAESDLRVLERSANTAVCRIMCKYRENGENKRDRGRRKIPADLRANAYPSASNESTNCGAIVHRRKCKFTTSRLFFVLFERDGQLAI